ncbi:MAG: beta-ketoacyl-ACP synthase II [Paludibacteraceae bacterium]|nr:beta-ketoacyl-ACP synthase II [Paludibacteraceae bacterium]
MNFRRVVITGVGAITPVGNDIPTYWDALLNGVSGAAPITLFDATNFRTQFACEVKNFDPLDHFEKKEARKYDRHVQFAMVAAKQSMDDANFDLEKLDTDRAGVIFSSGIGGITSLELGFEEFQSCGKFNPFYITKMIADMAAGHISMMYKFRGPNFGTVSACASSTHALSVAFDQIRLGRADVMITGGVETAITRSGIGGFCAMHALSTRNDDPQHASRPFSKSRDGFVMGEGAGSLVFEEYEHAIQRGAKIYAEVVGIGASADAYHMTATHPDGEGAILVMKLALQDAGMKPEDIDYINMHGTSTPVGDLSEVKAIKKVFGEHAYKMSLSSTKSMTGHLLGGTGAIEAIASILAIRDGIIPPTINHDEEDKDPEIDYNLDFTFNKAKKREVRASMSNTFGFGGHNATIIFKKFEG